MAKIYKKNLNGMKGIVCIGTNIVLIITIVMLVNTNTTNIVNVSAMAAQREEALPDNYTLQYSTVSAATTETNSQLGLMTPPDNFGIINPIDEQADYFAGRFFRDYVIGGIEESERCVYWELSDDRTEVYLDAESGEIISYFQDVWIDGSLTQQEIETRAYNIATFFGGSLPSDITGPDIEERIFETSCGINPDTGEETIEEQNYWFVRYNRTFETSPDHNILTQDFIRCIIDPSGNLLRYVKSWNMDFSVSFDDTYTVSQNDAETTALQYDGDGSVVVSASKKIVRPNYFWPVTESPLDEDNEPTIAYGLPPLVTWEIHIQDDDANLCVYNVHGRENKIVGGDFTSGYFSNEGTND